MSSIFAQLPNRLIMDIIKIRLDEDLKAKTERETLLYWINRMSAGAVGNAHISRCRRLKKQGKKNSEIRRIVGCSVAHRKQFVIHHIHKIAKEGYDMDSLYSDQAFYALRHQSNGYYRLTNATLRRRDNQ